MTLLVYLLLNKLQLTLGRVGDALKGGLRYDDDVPIVILYLRIESAAAFGIAVFLRQAQHLGIGV